MRYLVWRAVAFFIVMESYGRAMNGVISDHTAHIYSSSLVSICDDFLGCLFG